jgi:hypothetical protein
MCAPPMLAHSRRDLFFRDVPEGVACVVAGQYGSYTRPLAIVGGNCSVQVGWERACASVQRRRG